MPHFEVAYADFFSSLDLLFKATNDLFKTPCPHCKFVGHLIKHSKIYRRAKEKDETIHHGHRIFCSNRNNKIGCGRTIALNLTLKLPRLNRFTKQVNDFFLHYIVSMCACFSWFFAHPKCVDISAPYRFLRLVKKSYINLRPLLCNRTKPPDQFQNNKSLNLFQHIKIAFPENENYLEALILHLQGRVF